MSRYKVVEGSQSAHCCFDATVVDTSKPTIINGEPYCPDGVQQYEAVCEAFYEADAALICEALNFYDTQPCKARKNK